ncbi:protocadherin Fat 1 [Elysia marginata]|uniref:Protocadherin Fat 1 n=1 Tax=Elysia marginata TaxID=1093978 RepID=A0AAV4FL65_9GAST|nr:protocadherin Fat 1 [Elysia marginata]
MWTSSICDLDLGMYSLGSSRTRELQNEAYELRLIGEIYPASPGYLGGLSFTYTDTGTNYFENTTTCPEKITGSQWNALKASDRPTGRFESHKTTHFNCALAKHSSPSSKALFDTEHDIHVTFRESLMYETVLYDAEYENTTLYDVICVISSSRPSLFPDVLYTSGSLLLLNSNGSVNHNKTPEIYIRLKCIHGNRQMSQKTVVVHVTRDLAPSFLNIPETVRTSAKHSRVGDVIYQLTVEDRDSTALTLSAENCSCPFTVSADGRVTVVENLRKWTVSTFTLNIYLSDGFNIVGPVVLHVLITAHEVSIRPEVTLDYENLKWRLNLTSLPLLLTADDGALQSPIHRVYFIVMDKNEAPQFHRKILTITTNEGKAGSLISTTEVRSSVSDPDVDDSLTFHILPDNMTRMIAIDKVTGYIRFNTDYDVDPLRMPSRLTFTVRARDKGDLENSVTAVLHIKDVNEPPTVSAPASVTVAEDMAPGSSIFLVYVNDEDSQDTLEIIVECEDHIGKLFDVSKKGLVRLHSNAVLDFETAKVYSFVISAHDGHTTSVPVTTQLRVTNVNEAPHSSRQDIAVEAEEGKAGRSVSTYDLRDVVTDPDHDLLYFSIKSCQIDSKKSLEDDRLGTDGSRNEPELIPFSIDSRSGWLFLSLDVDVTRKEAKRVYRLLIEATDAGGLSVNLQITVRFWKIFLTFVNAAPTMLGLPADLVVFEDSSAREVFRVRAIDQDGDSVVFRHHVEGVTATPWIDVDSETGAVRLSDRRPDLAMGSKVKVTIVLTSFDGHSVSESGILTITVIGVNDAPSFSAKTYSYTIDETEVGIPFTLAPELAVDHDLGDTLTFTLATLNGTRHHDFLVNATSGELCVKADYDIDQPGKSSDIELILTATDSYGLSKTAQVSLTIQDINDNPPEVLNEGNTFYVDSAFHQGARIGQVIARDRDSGFNGKLRFQIVGSSLNDTNKYLRQVTPGHRKDSDTQQPGRVRSMSGSQVGSGACQAARKGQEHVRPPGRRTPDQNSKRELKRPHN